MAYLDKLQRTTLDRPIPARPGHSSVCLARPTVAAPSEHATRRLQGFHHRAQRAQSRCGRAHAGTVMDGRRDAPITKSACSPLQSHVARAAIGLRAQARLQIPSMRKQTRDRLTAAACECRGCECEQHRVHSSRCPHRAPHPARPSASAGDAGCTSFAWPDT
jgi:hypothetical protein